jgi:hypothetical protein
VFSTCFSNVLALKYICRHVADWSRAWPQYASSLDCQLLQTTADYFKLLQTTSDCGYFMQIIGTAALDCGYFMQIIGTAALD